MASENRYNLIDERWIPVIGHGLASLREIFTEHDYPALGGNPIEKIALTKLLLAIVQAAHTPLDDDDWKKNDSKSISNYALNYLDKWYDRFWLYGEHPFLQMPEISVAEMTSFGSVLPHIATGNTTILTESQIEKPFDEHDKALLILVQMGFAFSGKKTDNSVSLTDGYTEKTKTGKAGPSIGYMGFLHSFMLGDSILETLWLNLLTKNYIQTQSMYKEGLGIPPWEQMPKGENCDIAQKLKNSVMGRLLPLSRFCLLTNLGLHYSEGITHLDYADGLVDPSVSVNFSEKKPKVIWVNPDKRPWRYLTALLSFLDLNQNKKFDCIHLQVGLKRSRDNTSCIGIWSGGIKVTNTAGEQKVSGQNDFVESSFRIPADVAGTLWYSYFAQEMSILENISKALYSATIKYFKELNLDQNELGSNACQMYWQLIERRFQDLVEHCQDEDQMKQLRKVFVQIAHRTYDHYCPNSTARQLGAWASNRPNINKYTS